MKVPEDVYWKKAGEILRELKIPPQNHLLYQENLATYLAQFRDEFLKTVDENHGENLRQLLTHAYPYGEFRWAKKLEREIKNPYSDSEVLKHLDEYERRIKKELSQFLNLHPEMATCTVHLTGSLIKGRFGANSDVDLFLDPGENLIDYEIEKEIPDLKVLNQGSKETRQEFLDAFGERHSWNMIEFLQEEKPLSKIYLHALKEKGYEILNNQVWKIKRLVHRQKEVPPPNQRGIIWSFADLPV
jgi:predicted nucleotidyltransferase